MRRRLSPVGGARVSDRPDRGSTGAALLVILAGVVAALHVWKLAPALPQLSAELGLDLVEGGFLLSVVQLAGMALAIPVGMAGGRIGLRRGLLSGLALLTAASLVALGVDGYWPMLGTRVVEGVGFMLVTICAPALIRATAPPDRVSLLTGLWATYIPVAACLSLLLGGQLSWQAAWVVAGVCSGAVALAALRLLPRDRASVRTQSAWEGLRATVRAPGLFLVALMFLLYTAQWNGIVQFLPTMYADAGVQVSAAAGLTALVAGINAVGNVAAGAFLQRGVRPVRLWVGGFLVMAVGAGVTFGLAPLLDPQVQFAVRYAAILLFSTVGGIVPATIIAGLMGTAPTMATTATALGIGQQFSALGQFAGPPIVGAIAEAAGGSWDYTWTLTTVFAGTAVLLALRASRATEPAA